MRKLTCCPGILVSGFETYCPVACKKLFSGKTVSHIMDFTYNDEQYAVIADNAKHISVSGVQEKLSAVFDNGKIRLVNDGEQGRYILKPAPENKALRDRKQIPANEHLTMQIAEQIYKISTAANGMIFFLDGVSAYITKRFDVQDDGTKISQEDFASLMLKTSDTHGESFKYTGSYEDIALKIKELIPAWQIEMGKFFSLVLFNYLFSNGDAHLKNFSVQQTKDGDYILAPAYDLINTSLHTNDEDFALEKGLSETMKKSSVYLSKGHPCQDDFISFGRLIGLSDIRIKKIIEPFLVEQLKVAELIDHSFLETKQKRMYFASYRERLSRLQRKSEWLL